MDKNKEPGQKKVGKPSNRGGYYSHHPGTGNFQSEGRVLVWTLSTCTQNIQIEHRKFANKFQSQFINKVCAVDGQLPGGR